METQHLKKFAFSDTFLSCLVAGHNGLVAVSTPWSHSLPPEQVALGSEGGDFKSEHHKEGKGSLSVRLVSVQGQLEGTSWAPFLVLSPRQVFPWPVGRPKAYEISQE